MANININPLIDALGGNTATGATGTITAVVMAGGVPATRIAGAGVILPEPVVDTFTDGVLKEALVLDVLPTGHYWKFTIEVDGISKTFFFTIPEAGTYDFNELNFIDGGSLAPIAIGGERVQYHPTIANITGETIDAWYVKNGQMVSFSIAVSLAGATFGTGQVKLTNGLPFAPITGHYSHFNGWVNYDPTADPDVVGHYYVNADYVPSAPTTLDLHYLKAGSANQAIKEAMMTPTLPATLTTSSLFYITGTYITEAN